MNKKKARSQSCVIEELKSQQYNNYQHNHGTCVCGECICGNCKCRLAKKQGEYPRNLKSMYKYEYPWKSVEPTKRKPQEQYNSTQDFLNKESVYKDHYKPFYITPQPKKKQSDYIKNVSTFSAQTSYQRDYQLPKNSAQFALKPIDSIFNPTNLKHDLNTIYRVDYRNNPVNGSEEINFAKANARKLHTGNAPNLFLYTTYNSAYKGKQGDRPVSFNQQRSQMPFGLNGTNQYKTQHQSDYVKMEPYKCPARVTLQDIATQKLSQT